MVIPFVRSSVRCAVLVAGAALVCAGAVVPPSAVAAEAPVGVSVTEGSTAQYVATRTQQGVAGEEFTYRLSGSGSAAWGEISAGQAFDCSAAGSVLTCTAHEVTVPNERVVTAQVVTEEGTAGSTFTIDAASPDGTQTHAYTVAGRPRSTQSLTGQGAHTLRIKAPASGATPRFGSGYAFEGYHISPPQFTFELPQGVTEAASECTQSGSTVTCRRTSGGYGDYEVPVTVAPDAPGGRTETAGTAFRKNEWGAALGVDTGTPFVLDLEVAPPGGEIAPRHDHDGDGRSDMAAWYLYGDRHSALHTLLANADGTLRQPFGSYASNPGSWNVSRMQFTTGDYNGDGRADVGLLYDYQGGKVSLITALAKPDGGFARPVASWQSKPGGFYGSSMTIQSGDFNGDGRDDIAAWYAYSAGGNRIFTFAAGPDGGFAAPVAAHEETASWQRSRSKLLTGDFNGDGRDDLAALYGAEDGTLTAHSFLSTPVGGFTRTASWSSGTFGSFTRAHPHAGDFDGDGVEDLALWYDYADGRDGIFTLKASADGRFAAPVGAYQARAGSWTYPNMKVLTGDYDGDGRADIGTLYGYGDGRIAMFTWPGTASGFGAPRTGWRSDGKGYNHRAATPVRSYNH
ncbi:VCBS repeat-containing protein [Streptomyces sp. TRM66268-LWL]|uniref:VCBS repeat-containing protein n=1 Tax=Streptomyces polyasparticus TaxID=2767826 RepID=A0ABR7SHP5_9ACTN|nr:VCBS repeat-containing protein [Streptomyces polyasparticus]MBC9714117.1 VCBS repeat-containing protein [Streptomyces polyasparticus]